MRAMTGAAGLAGRIEVDSAASHPYRIGDPPDPRARDAARRRGYELGTRRARQVVLADFEDCDLILAMDFVSLEQLQAICPQVHRDKIGLLMPYATHRRALIVHDPYSRSAKQFEIALDYIEDACAGLLRTLAVQFAENMSPVASPRDARGLQTQMAGPTFGC